MLTNQWRNLSRRNWILVVVALVALDQATKAYFSASIPLFSSVVVTPWFNLVHTLNEGAAFSLLADAGGWQRIFLIIVSLSVVLPLTVLCMAKQTTGSERWLASLIVGGGTSNLIDRIQRGSVTDFLDLHWRGWHWPAFNLADVFIVTAAAGWVVCSLATARLDRRWIESRRKESS